MLTPPPFRYHSQHGVSLLEVLVTIVILAFGLLGLAGLQAKIQLVEVESFQRAQAILLLNDMSERISANRANAATYDTTTIFGKDNTQPSDCSSLGIGQPRDTCEWSNALKGAGEQISGANVGSLTDGRGCITKIQDENIATCTPGIYQVTVAWQGMHRTTAPASTCGQGSYGADSYRRAVSTRISVGMPTCL